MENANSHVHSQQEQSSQDFGEVSPGNSPLQAAADGSDQVTQLKALQSAANDSPQIAVQRQRQEAVTQRMQSQAPLQLLTKTKVANDAGLATTSAQARRNNAELNESSMGHNYAFNEDQRDLVTRSKGNTHSEPELSALSKGRQVRTDTPGPLNIVTERAPCGECENDLTQIENESGQAVNVKYFVDYPAAAPGADKAALWTMYQTLGLNGLDRTDPAAGPGLAQMAVTTTKVAADATVLAALATARRGQGFLNRSGMHRNYAINLDAHDLITHSKANGHSEPQLLGATISRMQAAGGGEDTINILTERQPCGRCAGDIQKIANESGKNINVQYLVDYPPAQAKGDEAALWEVYRAGGYAKRSSPS